MYQAKETLQSYTEQRGISEAHALANYKEWSAKQVQDTFGFDKVEAGKYIVFDPKHGSRQVRLGGKWLSAKGDRTLFAHNAPRFGMDQPEIWVTEGGAKMIALEQLGVPTMSLMGVTNWSERDSKDRRVLKKELVEALAGVETVYLCFDADWQTNYNVVSELIQFRNALTAQAIVCHYTFWPCTDQTKGIDDKLKTFASSFERLEFLQQLKKKPVPPVQVEKTLKKLEVGHRAKQLEQRIDEESARGIHIFDEKSDLRSWVRARATNYADSLGYRKTSGGDIVRLVDGVWVTVDPEDMRTDLDQLAGKLKKRTKDSLVVIGSDTWAYSMPQPVLKRVTPNMDTIRFLNGVYNLRTQTFDPGNTETYGATVPLEFKVTDELPLSAIAYLSEAVDGDLKRARAAMRYLIDPSIKAAKILHLSGESGSGKGTIMKMVKRLLPSDEVFEMFDPAIRMNDPTELYNIAYGKRLVNVGDLDCKLNSISAMLEMSGSSDGRPVSITVRPLFCKSMQIDVCLRFAISSVSPIRLSGSSDQGLMRRVFQVKTKLSPAAARFDGLSDVEAMQLFNWLMAMDREDCENTLRNEKDLAQQYERLTQLSEEFAFFDGHFKLDTEAKVPFADVLELYKVWADVNQTRTVSRNTFTARAKACLAPFGVKIEAENTGDGRRAYVYGIAPATISVSQAIAKLIPYTMALEHPGYLQPTTIEPTVIHPTDAEVAEIVAKVSAIYSSVPADNKEAPKPVTATVVTPPGLEDPDKRYIPEAYPQHAASPAGDFDWLPAEVQIYMETLDMA